VEKRKEEHGKTPCKNSCRESTLFFEDKKNKEKVIRRDNGKGEGGL